MGTYFEKYNDAQVNTLMAPYDYGSVMHYGPYDFAINVSSPTIVPLLNSSARIGQRVQLSPIDIIEIQRYYGCVSMPTSTSTTTRGAASLREIVRPLFCLSSFASLLLAFLPN